MALQDLVYIWYSRAGITTIISEHFFQKNMGKFLNYCKVNCLFILHHKNIHKLSVAPPMTRRQLYKKIKMKSLFLSRTHTLHIPRVSKLFWTAIYRGSPRHGLYYNTNSKKLDAEALYLIFFFQTQDRLVHLVKWESCCGTKLCPCVRLKTVVLRFTFRVLHVALTHNSKGPTLPQKLKTQTWVSIWIKSELSLGESGAGAGSEGQM